MILIYIYIDTHSWEFLDFDPQRLAQDMSHVPLMQRSVQLSSWWRKTAPQKRPGVLC